MFILLWLPVLVVIYWFFCYIRYERFLNKFPGPIPLPLVGSAIEFSSAKARVGRLLELRDQYNGDFKIYIGFEPILLVSEPETVEVILNSTVNLKKSKQYTFFKNWLGNGLLLSDGEYWRRHRKIITKAFHFQILEKYVEAFGLASNTLVQRFQSKVGEEAFDIYPYITLCTLDIMCESTMGISVGAQVNSDSEYVKNVKKIGQIIMDRAFSPLQQYDAFYRLTPTFRREEEALKVLHDQSYSVIDKKKCENAGKDPSEVLSSKQKLAFLDLLLHHNSENSSLTVEEIREEVDTLLFEGHDTTASCITFTLYCLANNPDIQEKVYHEIESILSHDILKAPTYQELNDMRYLEAAIKESMRLYPPVPIYGRELITDIKFGNKIMPKGLQVVVFAMGAHRNPKVFPDPLVFNPDRFLPENAVGRHPYAFVAFSAGPRNCIGQKFAMLEMKSTISTLLRHFRLLPSPSGHKVEFLLETVLRMANGTLINIEKR